MFAYVARQAILDKDKEVYSYELLFRDGLQNSFPDIPPDEATSKILTNSHLTQSIDEITSGHIAFINFHEDSLLNNFPTSLDPQLVVIEIVETVQLSEDLVAACKTIFDLGYKIAVDAHDFERNWDVLLPYISILKVDIVACEHQKIVDNIDRFKQADIQLVAEKVETHEQFEIFKALGFDYFQGFFFARPEVIKQKSLPSSKLSLMELLTVSASKDFDLGMVNSIIERDVALSYMLLRFINNPLINKSNKITSLRHALNYMGAIEVKKFVALLALANLGDSKSGELLNLSLVRAKFCDMLGQYKSVDENPPTGFLVGLFSLLDALLDRSMEDVVKNLPVDQALKQALCGQPNQLKEFLMLIRSFEVGHWKGVQRHSRKLDIDPNLSQRFYHEALKWAGMMKQAAIAS